MAIRKRFLLILLVIATLLSCVVPAYADSIEAANAYNNLRVLVAKGMVIKAEGVTDVDTLVAGSKADCIKEHTYKVSGGGYLTYDAITNNATESQIFNTRMYDDLTSGGKQEYLKDILRIANAASYYEAGGISDGTVTELCNVLQSYSGMGSQLMASLLAETKPDYATANKIYKPFSGIVGTILGFLSIIVMALVGVTMALDICYIMIPPFQLIIGAEKDGSGGGNGATKFAAKIISVEAQKAVQVSQNDGQNGEFKSAIGVYFKYRWKGLIVLGICLLYLVGGHIWNFVAWFIDLFSGFLGF